MVNAIRAYFLRLRISIDGRLIKILQAVIFRLSFWHDYLIDRQIAASTPERYDRPEPAGRYSRMDNR